MSSIVDFRRYRGLIAVGIPMALVMFAINLLLLIATGASPEWLVPAQTPLSWRDKENAESLVKGLVQATHSSRGDDVPFLLYIGMSTAREGIETKRLAAPDAYGNRVAGLCGSGGSMDLLRSLADPLIRNDVHPRLTLICIHPAWLVGLTSAAPPATLSPVEPILKRDLHELGRRLSWLAWLYKNRTSINHAIRTLLFRTRLTLGIVPVNRDPWEAPKRLDYPEHAPPEFLRVQRDSFHGYGWFDTRSYAIHQQSQAAALIDLIVELHKLGSDVVIVLMPEQFKFRNEIPTVARRFLEQKLDVDLDSSAPPIWNLSDAIPDEMFSDYCHLNDAGRSHLSALLAERLRNNLARKQ